MAQLLQSHIVIWWRRHSFCAICCCSLILFSQGIIYRFTKYSIYSMGLCISSSEDMLCYANVDPSGWDRLRYSTKYNRQLQLLSGWMQAFKIIHYPGILFYQNGFGWELYLTSRPWLMEQPVSGIFSVPVAQGKKECGRLH